MIVMYSPITGDVILVIKRHPKYLLIETPQLASAEFSGGLADRFLGECGYVEIGIL